MGIEQERSVSRKRRKSKYIGDVAVEGGKRVQEKDVMEINKGDANEKMKNMAKKMSEGNINGNVEREHKTKGGDREAMEGVHQHKKGKKIEKGKKSGGSWVLSASFVENEGDACLGSNEMLEHDGKKYNNKGEVLGDSGVAENIEKKKKKKEKEKGTGVAENIVKMKKKKENEKEKEKVKKSGGSRVVNDSFVENEGDACFDNNEMLDPDGKKCSNEDEVLEESGVAENVEKEEKKKEKGKTSRGSSVRFVENEVDASLVNNDEMLDPDVKKSCNEDELLGESGVSENIGKKKTTKEEVKKKKKKKKGEKKSDKDNASVTKVDLAKSIDSRKDNKRSSVISGKSHEEEITDKVERRKRKREKEVTQSDLKGVHTTGEGHDGEVMEKLDIKNKKRVKWKSMDDLSAGEQESKGCNLASSEGKLSSVEIETQHADNRNNSKGKRKKANLENKGTENTKAKRIRKKVSFSSQVDVFPLSTNSKSKKSKDGAGNLVRGKRFSAEEDEIVKESVSKYIEEHALGEKGLDMVLSCRSHPEIRDCWKHIATAIPYRPQSAIYYRAQVLFRRGDKRKYTEEEYEIIKKYQEEHGNKWKELAEELGKHRFHVKDTWRRIRLENRNKGRWSQDEYQNLFDLVHTDLKLKLSEEKKSKHGMLRDNIHWSAISDKLLTRSDATCCLKWYRHLSSPMVAEGLWSDADDYRLIDALYNLDASCMEDVDWDNLLEHRSGDVCRKRWNQMVLYIGEHGSKSFSEQVDILAMRYCPDLLEVREAWDSKPISD